MVGFEQGRPGDSRALSSRQSFGKRLGLPATFRAAEAEVWQRARTSHLGDTVLPMDAALMVFECTRGDDVADD